MRKIDNDFTNFFSDLLEYGPGTGPDPEPWSATTPGEGPDPEPW